MVSRGRTENSQTRSTVRVGNSKGLNMQDILDRLRSEQAGTLEELCEFLRIPSVSADSAFAGDVRRCAEWVRNAMQKAGLKAEIHPTKGSDCLRGTD